MDERQLREVFDLCDVGWVFSAEPSTQAERVFREMQEVDKALRERVPHRRLAPLADAILEDVTRLKPLVQTFASPMTTPIRAMVYCVLDGAQVLSITFDYEFKSRSRLKVEVEYETGERAGFESDDLWDAEALRHFGLMKLGDAPVVDGYYAFRKRSGN